MPHILPSVRLFSTHFPDEPDFGMRPRIVPANLFALPIHFVTVGANAAGGEVDQFPDLQMDSTLAFDAALQPGEGGSDRGERQRRTGDDRMAFRDGINVGAVAGEVVQRRAHAPAGERVSAPRPDWRRNSRRCS